MLSCCGPLQSSQLRSEVRKNSLALVVLFPLCRLNPRDSIHFAPFLFTLDQLPIEPSARLQIKLLKLLSPSTPKCLMAKNLGLCLTVVWPQNLNQRNILNKNSLTKEYKQKNSFLLKLSRYHTHWKVFNGKLSTAVNSQIIKVQRLNCPLTVQEVFTAELSQRHCSP